MYLIAVCSRYLTKIKLQWNPDFSNPRFLKHPDNLNQNSFPSDLPLSLKFVPDMSNLFLIPLEV